jgi:hypothetical protein
MEDAMLEILSGFPDNVLAVAAHGRVTADDYRKVLEPAVAAKMVAHKPLRFFIHLGQDYDGFAPGALVQDARIGLSRWKDWGAIAVVTDSGNIHDVTGFFALFFHHPMRNFFDADYEKAKAWISADQVKKED